MVVTAKSIRARADKDLADLRRLCRHPRLSTWAEEHWAPGHSTGFNVQYCLKCEETVHRRTSCWECEITIVDTDIVHGDGQKVAYGGSYCQDCLDRLMAGGKSRRQ